jgi:hypothetical protein
LAAFACTAALMVLDGLARLKQGPMKELELTVIAIGNLSV